MLELDNERQAALENDTKLDDLITKALTLEYNTISCPSEDEIIKGVQAKMRKYERAELMHRLRPALVACGIAAVFLIVMLGFQTPVKAFSLKFIQTIFNISDDTFEIYNKAIFGDKAEPTPVSSKKFDDPRVGEAQKEISFEILVPSYVPENYTLTKVTVSDYFKEQQAVELYYESMDNNSEFYFYIKQTILPMDIEQTVSTIKGNADVDKVKINGDVAYFVEKEPNNLIWNSSDKNYTLIGTFDKKTMLKIAESMK